MSDRRVRRHLALGAIQLFLLTTVSLSLAAAAQAQDDSGPPALTLEAGADPMTYGAVGEVVLYGYSVTNTGGVALDGVTLTDTMVPDASCASSGPLEPGAQVICTGSHTITQADVDLGSVPSVAEARARSASGEEVTSGQVGLTVTYLAPDTPAPPALTLEAGADPMTYGAVGEVVLYGYSVTNTGGVALDGVTLTDTMVQDASCASSGPLEPGAQVICTGSHTITQADVDLGSVPSVAEARARSASGEEVTSGQVGLTVTYLAPDTPAPPALTLEAGADPMTYGAVGEVVLYGYSVTNTGGVALDGVTLTDTMVQDASCASSGPLEPGAQVICTGSHTITQADVDLGSVPSVAEARARSASGEEVTSGQVGLTVTYLAPDTPAPPALTLEMESVATTFSAVGEEIIYDLWLTNTGGVALDGVTLTDTMVQDASCASSGPLEPGAQVICTGSHTITQADVDLGSVPSVAEARARSASGEEVTSGQVGLTVTYLAPDTPAPPALTLEMESVATTFSAVGEEIIYDLWLTNTGGVAVDAVSVTHTMVDDVTCESGPLEPGGSYNCGRLYIVTQADLDAGSVTNSAQGHGTYGDGQEVASDEVSLTITYLAPEPPALTLEMESVATTFSAVGEEIIYDLWLTNTGGVALDAVSVTHTMVDDVTCESGPLEPGGSYNCGRLYIVTQADLDAGSVTNSAQGHGTYGDGQEVASDEVSLTVTYLAPDTPAPAALTLVMTSDVTTFSLVDEIISYSYELTNTGGVTLDAVSITNTKVKGDVTCPDGPLEPGGWRPCLGLYRITQADLDAGSFTNIAQAHGTHGASEAVASNEASLTFGAVSTEPAALTLETGADPMTYGAVDEIIVYAYELTNTGGVTLDAVSVTDGELGDVGCPSGPVEPGGSVICNGVLLITEDHLDAGSVTNSAQAHGTYGAGEEVASNEVSVTIAAVQEPAGLTLEMESVATTFSAVDDRIEYDYLLTNTGGVTLDAVSVSPKLGDVSCTSVSLEPDRAILCIGYYYITQADLDAGSVTNIAQAHGTHGTGEEVASEEASLTIAAVSR